MAYDRGSVAMLEGRLVEVMHGGYNDDYVYVCDVLEVSPTGTVQKRGTSEEHVEKNSLKRATPEDWAAAMRSTAAKAVPAAAAAAAAAAANMDHAARMPRRATYNIAQSLARDDCQEESTFSIRQPSK